MDTLYTTSQEKWDEINAIFENAAVVLILADKDSKIAHINKSGIDMVGKDTEDIIGLVGGEVFNCINAWKDNKVVCGKTNNCKNCIIRSNIDSAYNNHINNYKTEGPFEVLKNDQIIKLYLSVSTSLIQVNNAEFVLLTIEDITTLKIQEFELKELNETKNKFFSIFAHDLKSPFSILIGFTELLNNNLENANFDIQTIKSYAKYIKTASYDINLLLENLLEWSRTQLGMINYNPTKELLSELINNSIKPLKSIADNKQINIAINISNDITISIDKHIFDTVIRNLLSNAIKFSKPGDAVEINTITTPDLMTLSIIDRGLGMSTEKIKDLFKLDKINSTKGTNNERGSGIGLIICKDYIERIGGEIQIKSEIGVGSNFTILVPLIKT